MLRSLVLCLLMAPFIVNAQMSTVELVVKPVPKPITRDTATDNWNIAQPEYRNLTAGAKDVLYWTNYCRRQPMKFWDSVVVPILKAFPNLEGPESQSLKAAFQSTGSLPMFSLNTQLIKTAQNHAYDICKKPSPPSHTSVDGTSFGSRMKQAGIHNCASENMSLGNQDPLLSVVLLYLDIGLPDMGHRKSLLNPELLEMGIGYAKYDKGRFFIVQDFACKQD